MVYFWDVLYRRYGDCAVIINTMRFHIKDTYIYSIKCLNTWVMITTEVVQITYDMEMTGNEAEFTLLSYESSHRQPYFSRGFLIKCIKPLRTLPQSCACVCINLYTITFCYIVTWERYKSLGEYVTCVKSSYQRLRQDLRLDIHRNNKTGFTTWYTLNEQDDICGI